MRRLALLGLLVAGVAGGCRRPAPAAPAPTAFEKFRTAIHKGDYLAAYELLPITFRRTYTKADFVRMMAGEAVVPASLQPPPPTFSNATPREAIRAFVLAWQRERWDVILVLVPSRFRDRLNVDTIREQFATAENQKLMLQLAQNLDTAIAVDGDRARMAYGAGFEVRLVREPDGWKIDDID